MSESQFRTDVDREFQTDGAAVLKERLPKDVRMKGTSSSGADDDRKIQSKVAIKRSTQISQRREYCNHAPLSSLWYSSTIWYMKPFLSEKFWFLSAPSSVSIIGISLPSIALIRDVRPSAIGLSSFAPFYNPNSQKLRHTTSEATTLWRDIIIIIIIII